MQHTEEGLRQQIRDLQRQLQESKELPVYAENLRYWRKQRNISQAALATAMGLNFYQQIGVWERGQHTPSVAVILDLCAVLEITPNDLLLKRS